MQEKNDIGTRQVNSPERKEVAAEFGQNLLTHFSDSSLGMLLDHHIIEVSRLYNGELFIRPRPSTFVIIKGVSAFVLAVCGIVVLIEPSLEFTKSVFGDNILASVTGNFLAVGATLGNLGLNFFTSSELIYSLFRREIPSHIERKLRGKPVKLSTLDKVKLVSKYVTLALASVFTALPYYFTSEATLGIPKQAVRSLTMIAMILVNGYSIYEQIPQLIDEIKKFRCLQKMTSDATRHFEYLLDHFIHRFQRDIYLHLQNRRVPGYFRAQMKEHVLAGEFLIFLSKEADLLEYYKAQYHERPEDFDSVMRAQEHPKLFDEMAQHQLRELLTTDEGVPATAKKRPSKCTQFIKAGLLLISLPSNLSFFINEYTSLKEEWFFAVSEPGQSILSAFMTAISSLPLVVMQAVFSVSIIDLLSAEKTFAEASFNAMSNVFKAGSLVISLLSFAPEVNETTKLLKNILPLSIVLNGVISFGTIVANFPALLQLCKQFPSFFGRFFSNKKTAESIFVYEAFAQRFPRVLKNNISPRKLAYCFRLLMENPYISQHYFGDVEDIDERLSCIEEASHVDIRPRETTPLFHSDGYGATFFQKNSYLESDSDMEELLVEAPEKRSYCALM